MESSVVTAGSQGNPLIFFGGLPVLDPIEPGYSVRVPARPVNAAGALEPVGDDTPYTDAQALVVVDESDRVDLDAMEHERQSRLARWQRQP